MTESTRRLGRTGCGRKNLAPIALPLQESLVADETCERHISVVQRALGNVALKWHDHGIRYAAIAVVALLIAIRAALPASAQDPAEGLFAGVKALYASSQSKADAERLEDYQGIRRLLDLIVEDYPSSDLAVGILLQDTIDGVDIAAIDADLKAHEEQLSATSVADDVGATGSRIPAEDFAASDEAQTTNPQISKPLTASNASSERALNLNRSAVRDIQARLTVLGFDPNGIDGVIGNGTRAALSRWQEARGLFRTGFLDTDQLELLKRESQTQLDTWLQDKRNAERYAPSPQRASTQRGLRNGWYIRNGKYCRRIQLGLQYCTPKRPPDA